MTIKQADALERARRRASERDAVCGYLCSLMPQLDQQAALGLLADAGSGGPRSLARIAAYLSEHPDPLRTGPGDLPAPLRRVAFHLHRLGQQWVVLPCCAGCGKARARLVARDPSSGGFLCGGCYERRDHQGVCARCGRTGAVALRGAEGRICRPCYDGDPKRHEPCARCGAVARVARRDADGTARCFRCAPPAPAHTCHRCGRTAPAAAHTEFGAVCHRCYRAPEGECGKCGRLRPVKKRADEQGPALCAGCYRGRVATCSRCGRERPCWYAATSAPLCQNCVRWRTDVCHRCGHQRRVVARWPIGATCKHCYAYLRGHPEPCPVCAGVRPLIGYGPGGERVCGPCAGVKVDHDCVRCGASLGVRNRGRCARCHLSDRLEQMTVQAADGPNRAHIRALTAVLAASSRPRGVLKWLEESHGAGLLAALAGSARPITHEALDELPASHAVYHVRDLLVASGILPARNEHLARVEPWLQRVLAGKPPGHRSVILPYAQWYVLRRARRRSERHAPVYVAAAARERISAAIMLLDRLHEIGVELGDLTQTQLEDWLLAHPSRRERIRAFITWTTRHRLTGRLTVPRRTGVEPAQFLEESELQRQLARCIEDRAMPLALRVTGALVLLYGLQLPRVARLTREDVLRDGERTLLRVGARAVPVPPRLADLLHQLAETPTGPGLLGDIAAQRCWLLPGRIPHRPPDVRALGESLSRHGVTAQVGRNSALLALAGDLPAPLLADATALRIKTATQWTRRGRRDATAYLAARRLLPADTPRSPRVSS